EFPITNYSTMNSSITIDDIDGDGDFEIISGTLTGVAIWDYKNLKGSLTPWTIYRGNIRRTGNYGDNIITSIDNILYDNKEFALYQNYPNPFSPFKNGITTIHFAAKHAKHAEMKIYNVKGQLVKEFKIQSPIKLGTKSEINKVEWGGKDNNGNQVLNGIYFYRLLTENYTSPVKRLLLLR
ncbi:MAG: T9SS type A sorting domain-containing protein, partial [Candidatus Cloacimonetes bacterium]|nr:T9SS type A sorting domain-containing protein [Candidatus Cloacimonadota bacterium]